MGRELRLILAKGEQKVRSAQKDFKTAPRNILGRIVQDSLFHFLGLRIRSLNSELGSVSVP